MGFSAKTLVIAGAAAATLAVGIMPANAAGTFTVKAGTAANGVSVGVTGATVGASPQVTFVDVTQGQTLTCASAGAKGTVVPGGYSNGAQIGGISGTTSSFNGCLGPLGIQLVVAGTGTWKIVQTGTTAAGVTTGRISAVKAVVQTPDGVQCKFTVTGSVPITFTNSSQQLATDGSKANLKVSGVTGCFGLIKNNDKSSFAATYALSANAAKNNPITITNP